MSDYAAPILGTVGAIVGSFTPMGPAMGWAIGYSLGNPYTNSQQIILSPRIREKLSLEAGL